MIDCSKNQHDCAAPIVVNDIHAKLNPTRLAAITTPQSIDELAVTVRKASADDHSICVAGGRHAMGGQQFADNGWLIDMHHMNQVCEFDQESGLITVQAGIQWPELMRHCVVAQHGHARQWGIVQKQTGADRLSIGGAIAANIHGRGLGMQPFVQDLVSLKLVDAHGTIHTCSRTENPELFSLVVGGYGLFGIVAEATLQLGPRYKVERVVELLDLEELPDAFQQRIDTGYQYGDFQFAIDPHSADFLRHGVFSCYRPVSADRPIPHGQLRLSKANWQRLLGLAHTDKTQAFREFADFYLKSSGQLYWSDTHQLSLYLDDYHCALDKALGVDQPGSEMITELYVPMRELPGLMDELRETLRMLAADVIYGTIRLIRRDTDSFLAWASQDSACIIFNIHTD
ncbi:MAG: FAD-binding oxidoreductase, partial [Candidatus Competibacteraceae bacterium]|nr:FAD-binding oxidoreductase [Candidatus Competibacteraceae bacterium]